MGAPPCLEHRWSGYRRQWFPGPAPHPSGPAAHPPQERSKTPLGVTQERPALAGIGQERRRAQACPASSSKANTQECGPPMPSFRPSWDCQGLGSSGRRGTGNCWAQGGQGPSCPDVPERPGLGLTLDKMVTLKRALVRLQDTTSIDKHLLRFYMLMMSYQKEKLREKSHL